MKDLTYIKVKEGKLWASYMVKPDADDSPITHSEWLEQTSGTRPFENWLSAKHEAFDESFVQVGNPEFLDKTDLGLPIGFIDGHSLYPSPVSGLQFEVREQYYHEYDDEWYDSGGLQFSKTRKVAILSIKSQSKCCKLNPNGCEDCTEFDKLNTPQAVAILSLKQEQPKCEDRCDWPNCTMRDCKDKQEQQSEEKEKVWLVITKQLLIVGCFSTEEKARKYTGAGVDVFVQGLEVL